MHDAETTPTVTDIAVTIAKLCEQLRQAAYDEGYADAMNTVSAPLALSGTPEQLTE